MHLFILMGNDFQVDICFFPLNGYFSYCNNFSSNWFTVKLFSEKVDLTEFLQNIVARVGEKFAPHCGPVPFWSKSSFFRENKAFSYNVITHAKFCQNTAFSREERQIKTPMLQCPFLWWFLFFVKSMYILIHFWKRWFHGIFAK